MRHVSNRELADLPEAWENPKVDTSKYRQCASGLAAWEVTEAEYQQEKAAGELCQVYQGRYYIAVYKGMYAIA